MWLGLSTRVAASSLGSHGCFMRVLYYGLLLWFVCWGLYNLGGYLRGWGVIVVFWGGLSKASVAVMKVVSLIIPFWVPSSRISSVPCLFLSLGLCAQSSRM